MMLSNDFEKAFSEFIDQREYDQAENALFNSPSESMGGTRGELVPAREAHCERSELYNFRKNCVRLDIPKDGIKTDLTTE